MILVSCNLTAGSTEAANTPVTPKGDLTETMATFTNSGKLLEGLCGRSKSPKRRRYIVNGHRNIINGRRNIPNCRHIIAMIAMDVACL